MDWRVEFHRFKFSRPGQRPIAYVTGSIRIGKLCLLRYYRDVVPIVRGDGTEVMFPKPVLTLILFLRGRHVQFEIKEVHNGNVTGPSE